MNGGFTNTERILARLCRSSFLSLWTYPNAYRDQKATGSNGDGKEICDALIAFGNKVILFSDKEIKYRSHQDPNVSWNRWYKKAIAESKNQIEGGVRWITQHPDRVFADKKCTQRIDISEGTHEDVTFYRIVVANGISSQVSRALGGSGSLMIAHSGRNPLDATNVGMYEIGSDYQDDAIYHVFDENNLQDILESLDTISDFVAYLDSRERLFRSGTSVVAPGEEDLLAQYLQHFDLEVGRGFEHFRDTDLLWLGEGTWAEFKDGSYFQSAKHANRSSRLWDQIIEHFSGDLLGSRLRGGEGFSKSKIRLPLSLMASENRFSRRTLSECVYEVCHLRPDADQYVRVIQAAAHRPTTYVMFALRHPNDVARDDYVSIRAQLLYDYCLVAKWKYQVEGNIVGIGLDRIHPETTSFDLVHFEPGCLTNSEIDKARALYGTRGFLANVSSQQIHSFEYPHEGAPTRQRISNRGLKGNMRNRPCPCRSGRKHKQCCGRKSQVTSGWEFIDLDQ